MLKRTGAGLLGAATALVITAGALAAPAVAARDDHRATQRALDEAVTEGVPGVTARASADGRSWQGTSGRRGARDHYRVGSLTKTFVATVVLQLEAEGRLDLDDTVGHWLPGLVEGHGYEPDRITLRHLLGHTSGIHDYLEDPQFAQTYLTKNFLDHRFDTFTPEQLVGFGVRNEPRFAPGARWDYSNTNYALAALIVEKATGHAYGDEIERRITGPLKLRATSVPGTDPRLPRPRSRAYSKLGDPTGDTYDVTEYNPSGAYGSGEMISDSADLNRFYAALLRGELLPPAQLAEMTTTVPVGARDPDSGYGLGLQRWKLACGVVVWGHGGDIHGSSAMALTTRDGRHSLAFDFNADWAGSWRKVAVAEYC
ncbi:serine hydrolase domain-containing protein [Streptomyces longispororuber]|uniref:serine hydrolase domain-containing protein n=1 Tax=Streptomyces longispororuber TaxID=68230 RepID=UPI00210A74A6|nr:serine hydrolase domain-containing protein [Streptomyces longispororuber]MCQ4211967.1 beta-lactamase family protein [Streptomyces longispororuber]